MSSMARKLEKKMTKTIDFHKAMEKLYAIENDYRWGMTMCLNKDGVEFEAEQIVVSFEGKTVRQAFGDFFTARQSLDTRWDRTFNLLGSDAILLFGCDEKGATKLEEIINEFYEREDKKNEKK